MSTVVALHAHPDDESLLTGGTLAALSAAGHRVVLIMATSGERGLAADPVALGARRSAEADAAAALLGCARVVHLGYQDSGWAGSAAGLVNGDAFACVPVATAAERIAAILRAESADLLVSYDSHGGYGHPDHIQVHRVGIEAARRAGTPRVVEATVDRTLILTVVRILRAVRLLPVGTDAAAAARWYSSRAEITHRVRVRHVLTAKRRALACHLTQTGGGDGQRTVRLLLGLPGPLFALAAGTEWFVERDTAVPAAPLTDILTPAPRRPPSPPGAVTDHHIARPAR